MMRHELRRRLMHAKQMQSTDKVKDQTLVQLNLRLDDESEGNVLDFSVGLALLVI